MDPSAFDTLVRSFSSADTRRRMLGRLATLVPAVGLGMLLEGETGARTRSHGRNRGHHPGKDKDNRKGKRHGGHGQPGASQPTFPVCHDGQTLLLPLPEATAHLAHGDTAGPCGGPPRGTCAPLGNVCNVPFGNPCCSPSECTQLVADTKFSPTMCMGKSCATTAQCAALFPNQDVACDPPDLLGFGCPALADKCCRAKACTKNKDCPKSGVCCSFLDIGTRCCAPGQHCTPFGCL